MHTNWTKLITMRIKPKPGEVLFYLHKRMKLEQEIIKREKEVRLYEFEKAINGKKLYLQL